MSCEVCFCYIIVTLRKKFCFHFFQDICENFEAFVFFGTSLLSENNHVDEFTGQKFSLIK